MTDQQTERSSDWPDEEGGPQAQDGLRSDIGGSMQRPAEEDSASVEQVGPTGERGPAGAGEVAGRGSLGSTTPTEKGAEQGPR